MLSHEENQYLTKTGLDTPMGKLLRRYWIPALLSEEIARSDGPPVRVRIMGEDLLAFRDSKGRVGLVDEYCPHRRVSMYYGRNEECGIRCVYHGWKFDKDGNCVDMPSEPAESSIKEKLKIKSYACRERGGVIWTYMGPPDLMPELPELEWSLVPDSHRYITRRIQENNYFQALEGGLDSSHISFLHRGSGGQGFINLTNYKQSTVPKYLAKDTAPKYEVEKSDFGLLIGAKRDAEEGKLYWRITPFLMPWYTMIPPFEDVPRGAHAWVPVDDQHCMTWNISWNPLRPLTMEELGILKEGFGIHMPAIPGTEKTLQNRDNEYFINRDWQASGTSYTGIKGLGAQDAALQETQGAIADRSLERLGSSDAALIAARRLLITAAKKLEKGEEPPALNVKASHIRSTAVILPEGVPFQVGAKDLIFTKEGDFVAATSETKLTE